MPSDQPAQPPRVPSAAAVAAKPAPRHSHLPTALRVVAVLIFIAAAAYLAHAFWSGIQYAVTPQADDTGIVPNVVSLPGLGLSLGVELAIGLVMLALFVGSTILLLATRTRYLGAPELAAPAPLAERPAAEPAPEHPGATPVAQAVQFVPRVFISHSRADDEFGHKLVARLRTELGDDDSVWYDSAGGLWAGDEWWMRILKELSERNVFLIVLSPDSMASKWCQDELNLAWQDKNSKDRSRRKVIVPVMYRTTEVPQYLTIVQFADFTNDERFEEAFERLVRVVRAGRTVEVVPSVESGPPFDLALLPLPTHFVGREAELSWLREHLAEGATTLGIVAVNGLGGIGKTGLAAKAVRDLRAGGRFPDGIAVVLCQDKRSEGDALLILANVLTRFDPFRRAPEATDIVGLSEVARRLLLGKDVLIVLDNVEPELPIALVVAPLREAGATVLLTARSLLPADVVPPEGRLPLDLLTETEALDLLAKSLGNYEASDLSADELQAARRIVASLDRHTLAVTLAGAYVADGRDLATLAAELADPQRALRLPKGNVPDAVKHAFLSSYDALSDDARKLFTALSALPTLNFSREAAAALGKGVGLPEAETDVDALARLALATSLPGDRLRLHPLIQALADAEFATWPLPERNSAYLAMVRYYAAYSKHATDVGREADEDNIAGALVRAATLEQESLVGEIAEGMQTYWRERSQSEAASRASLGERNVRREAKARVDEREFVRLANLDYSYAELQMHLGDVDTAERYLSQSVENYRASHQRREESLALAKLGDIALQRGDLAKAEDCYDRVLVIMREVRDRRAESSAYSKLGDIALLRGDLVSAERHYELYLVAARELRDRRGEALALSRLGDIARQRGALADAFASYEQALAMMREMGDVRGEGVALSLLGDILAQQGDLAGAQANYEQYLAIMRQVGDRREEGVALSNLGDIALQRGDLDAAQAYYEYVLAIMREVGDIREEGVALSKLGDILQQRGELVAAQAYYKQSLAIMREISDRRSEAVALSNLGQIALQRGQAEGAARYFEQSLQIRREVRDRRGEAVMLAQLAVISAERSELDVAEAHYREALVIFQGVQDVVSYADVAEGFGEFLIGQRAKRDEGCQMLLRAAEIYEQIGAAKQSEQARETAQRSGCG